MKASSLAGHVVELVGMIVRSSSPADRVISDFYRDRRYLGSHDRRWISEKVYGILRNFIFLREIAGSCAPRLGPAGIFLVNEMILAGMTPEDAGQTYAGLIETYRLSGNAVDLASLSSCAHSRTDELTSRPDALFIRSSFPGFFERLLPVSVRSETREIMDALNREGPLSIRINSSRTTREEVIGYFRKIGIEAAESGFSPVGIRLPKRVNLNTVPLYRQGLIEIQEEASQLVGLVADPASGETIVDACAGAGGKSLEIADLSGDAAKIYSLDVDGERLANLRARCARAGFRSIAATRVREGSYEGLENLLSAADKVVVDAPCSGSGTIRRNPDKKFRMTEESVARMSANQKKILSHYSGLVRPGGTLIYSTCSLFESENAAVVRSFLDDKSDFELVPLPLTGRATRVKDLIEDGFIRIYPHRHEMDGFFVAVMKRVS